MLTLSFGGRRTGEAVDKLGVDQGYAGGRLDGDPAARTDAAAVVERAVRAVEVRHAWPRLLSFC